MKFNKIYLTTWKLFKAFTFAFITYYIAENIAFSIIYGWHWTAQSDIERYFDLIYNVLGVLSQIFFLVTIFGVIEFLLGSKDK